MKLGKRLAAIAHQVKGPYHAIWDCCCDHGQLGMALLASQHAQTVHFVDCVPSITAQLQTTLATCASATNYRVHTMDVFDLPLDQAPCVQSPPLAQLIVIAGVGGELTLAMVQHLAARFASHSLEFLLCPVRHQYALRQGLINSGLSLVDEVLIEENRRFYEIIHLSNTPRDAAAQSTAQAPLTPLQPRGSKLWQPFGELQQHYLTKQLQHWALARRGSAVGSDEDKRICAVLEDYHNLQNTVLKAKAPL
ncbi:MAG: tRNA (adenine(22)-N(1))-methyltransferase [Pseudomonadales bacterium]